MELEDVEVHGEYVKLSSYGKKPQLVKCVGKSDTEVRLIVDDESSCSHGMRFSFNRIECERYLYK